MEQKNDTLGDEDVVFMFLETLKSNGTFDEIRRHCITDIDSKPTYQNWKQRIESNVNKFLSKVKYTPELNKNTVRERLRKHLLDGCESQEIEEGADRILNQVLAPRSLSIFEPIIAVAVDEYLGIKNGAPPIELKRLKESSMNLRKSSNIEISTVFNHNKIDFIPDADNKAYDKILKGDGKNLRSGKKRKSSSLCIEPTSLKGSQSEDENDAGGSSKQKSNQHKTSTSDKSKSSSGNHKSSKKYNSCKEIVEGPKSIVKKSKDVIYKPKDIVDKSKDIVNKPKGIVEKYKDNVNKPKDIVDKSKENSFLLKNSYSSSLKSNQTDTKITKCSLEKKKKSSSLCREPKLLNGNQRDDESNSGGSPKQKSIRHKNKSSLSVKTKLSSSNRKSSGRDNNSTYVVDKSKDKSLSMISDRTADKSKYKYLLKNLSSTDVDKSKDKSSSKNSTISDIDKSKKRSLSKNSSSTDVTDKYKIKSSLIKNTRCTDVVENSKDKCLSKDSSSSSHKNNNTNPKKLKLSPVEKNKSPTNNVNDEETKPDKPKKFEWNDFQSAIRSNNDIDIIMKDSASTLSNQISHKKLENNNEKILDDDKSLNTFKGFFETDAIPCGNYKLLKNVIETLQVQINNLDKIETGFKGFTNAETNMCKHRDNVYTELIKLKESKCSTGFLGFPEEDAVLNIGHKYVVKQLELAKKQTNVDNRQQNVNSGGNGFQNGKTSKEIMAAYLYRSNNDNDSKLKENYSKPINDAKKHSPTVNNNNHNYDNWVVEQKIKYKLLPVSVKLVRLMEYGCNSTHIINSKK